MNRGLNKIPVDYSTPDIIKYYNKKTGNPRKLSQKQFSTITKDFFSQIIQMIIFENIEFTMPNRMGSVRVIKSKQKIKLTPDGKLDKRKLRPNWGATRKLWKQEYPTLSWEEIIKLDNKRIIFHENKHTEGYKHRWCWDKSTCAVSNITAYKLDIARVNDRKLAKALKNEDNELNFYTQ